MYAENASKVSAPNSTVSAACTIVKSPSLILVPRDLVSSRIDRLRPCGPRPCRFRVQHRRLGLQEHPVAGGRGRMILGNDRCSPAGAEQAKMACMDLGI